MTATPTAAPAPRLVLQLGAPCTEHWTRGADARRGAFAVRPLRPGETWPRTRYHAEVELRRGAYGIAVFERLACPGGVAERAWGAGIAFDAPSAARLAAAFLAAAEGPLADVAAIAQAIRRAERAAARARLGVAVVALRLLPAYTATSWRLALRLVAASARVALEAGRRLARG